MPRQRFTGILTIPVETAAVPSWATAWLAAPDAVIAVLFIPGVYAVVKATVCSGGPMILDGYFIGPPGRQMFAVMDAAAAGDYMRESSRWRHVPAP